MDFDDLLPEIGEYGTYQKLVLWFLLIPGTFPCAFHAYNQLFMASVPDHWCKIPELSESNLPLQDIRNISIPFDHNSGSFSKCFQFDLNYSSFLQNSYNKDMIAQKIVGALSVPCTHGWHYDMAPYSTSVVADFDLVCDRSFTPILAIILFSASGLVGSYIFGIIQDGWGRRPAFFIYLAILCVFGMPTAYMPSFWLWLATRIGVGFTIPAIMSTPFVLAIELVGPSYRTYTTIVMNVAVSFSLIILSAVVYFVQIWSQLALATIIPFLAFFGFWSILPESPRWLLTKGRVDEAFEVITTIARVNKRTLAPDFYETIKEKQSQTNVKKSGILRTFGIFDLFKTPNLRKKTLILTFIWFTNAFVYAGLSYYGPSLSGNVYLNFFLAVVIQLPTYIFLWPSMEFLGRRWTLCFTMIVGGCTCIASILSQNNDVVTLILYWTGKLGVCSSFAVLPLFASELYPTVVRGIGLGFSVSVGMIGPVIIPFINYLGKDMLVWPLIIMGILMTVGGFLALFLPETVNRQLPETIEECEAFRKETTKCCSSRNRSDSIGSRIAGYSDSKDNDSDSENDVSNDFLNESYSSLRRNSFLRAQEQNFGQKNIAISPKIESCRRKLFNERKPPAINVRKDKKHKITIV